MSLKSKLLFFWEKDKLKKFLKKHYGLWKKSKTLKNGLIKRYLPSEKKNKNIFKKRNSVSGIK